MLKGFDARMKWGFIILKRFVQWKHFFSHHVSHHQQPDVITGGNYKEDDRQC